MCTKAGLLKASDHVVVVQMVQNAFVVKILSVDEVGEGIKPIRPPSLMDMIKVSYKDGKGLGAAFKSVKELPLSATLYRCMQTSLQTFTT